MPTWRDSQRDVFTVNMDLEYVSKILKKQNAVLVLKPHMMTVVDKLYNADNIILADKDIDIYCILPFTDVLITDYSSVMFDYALLNRPILFFTYDLDFYKENLRDFYFDINTVPGPLIETTEELIAFIKNNSKEDYFEKYNTKYQAFKETYNEFDKGNSCKSVVELVKRLSE